MQAGLEWITAGRHFGFDDLVFWQAKGSQPFEAAAAGIDTILCGPHSSAAFPAELRPFIDPALTRRKQFDFSDDSIAALGRAWAAADPAVVYVENPVSRLIMDPNRPQVNRIEPGLRQAFAALAGARGGTAVNLSGIDTVRPVTFSGEPVLLEPQDDAGLAALVAVLEDCADRGPRRYARLRDSLIDRVLSARGSHQGLIVLSLHDTMNTQMTADGAIIRPRPEVDRLPWLVNLGNRGDRTGAGPADEVTLPTGAMRRLAAAFVAAWQIPPDKAEAAVTLNHPYKGAHETISIGARLREPTRRKVGAVQVEFLRETLLGPATTARLMSPGSDWPATDQDHLAKVVAALCLAWESFWRGRAW